MKIVKMKIAGWVGAFVVGSIASVAVAQQTSPIPGIGIVVKKNPSGSSITLPPTGVDGSFEVKGLSVGLYDVFIGGCAPIPFVVGEHGIVMGGVVTGDGDNMIIRQTRGGDPKSAGFKQSHSSGHASELVASCPMDARAKELWAQVRGADAVNSNTPATTAPEIFVHATGLQSEANEAAQPTFNERRAHARDHVKRDPALTTSFWNAAVANNQAELKRHLVLLGFDQASLNQSPVTIQKDPKTGEPISFTFATQTGPQNISFKGAGSPKNAGF